MREMGQVNGNARVVREFVAYLRVEKGLRPASCEAYRRDLEQFAEHVEGRDGLLVGATQGDVSGFMEGLRGHAVESRSIARKLSCLRGFYRWLLKDKRISHDPTVNVETPASWKVLPKSLAEGEVAEMLERTGAAARSDGADGLALRDHAILELLYAGGLRVGEIVALRVEDLHLDQARAQVRGKGDKERIVPLGRSAVEALEKYLTWDGRGWCGAGMLCSGLCFLSLRGNALTRQWVWEMVRGATARGVRLVRTCCGIAARRTWWSMARICGGCRRCWGMRILLLRRCIRMWRLGHLKKVHREHHPQGEETGCSELDGRERSRFARCPHLNNRDMGHQICGSATFVGAEEL